MADKRREFEQLTKRQLGQAPTDAAFIKARLELVRSDPRLTEEERERALADLRKRLTHPTGPADDAAPDEEP